MNIGILFRGPLRPTIKDVLANRDILLANFSGKDCKIETWLSTWNTWHGINVLDQLPKDSFNNIISQPEPSHEEGHRLLKFDKLPSTSSASRVWKTMLCAKTALDAMVNTCRYDYIIHARPDGIYHLQPYLDEWFRPDAVTTKHILHHINDFILIGKTDMIYNIWNYKNVDHLASLCQNVTCPENIIEKLAINSGVEFATARSTSIELHPNRNNGDDLK